MELPRTTRVLGRHTLLTRQALIRLNHAERSARSRFAYGTFTHPITAGRAAIFTRWLTERPTDHDGSSSSTRSQGHGTGCTQHVR